MEKLNFHSPAAINCSLRHMVSALGLSCPETPPQGAVEVAPPGSILVAIDFENTCGLLNNPGVNVNAQMGVVILDPMHLKGTSHPDHIQSFQFASGYPDYIQAASNKFVFGKTVACRTSEFITHLTLLLPPDRPFVLVAQNFSSDRVVLTKLGFDLDENFQFAGIVDTYPMSGDIFHAGRAFGSLKKILTTLGVGWNQGDLHCAGNDAHYTLRAALLLAERGYLESCSSPSEGDKVVLVSIRTMALAKVPKRECAALKSVHVEEMKAREAVQRERVHFRAELARLETEMEEHDALLQCLG